MSKLTASAVSSILQTKFASDILCQSLQWPLFFPRHVQLLFEKLDVLPQLIDQVFLQLMRCPFSVPILASWHGLGVHDRENIACGFQGIDVIGMYAIVRVYTCKCV